MKQKKINIVLRIPKVFYQAMMNDLRRPHPFASERVGFFSTGLSQSSKNDKIVTITGYHTVADSDYINDPLVGAKISSNSIREAMQRIISTGKGCLHVHLHNHTGQPSPSYTDLKSLSELSKAFHNADPATASGYIIFSYNSSFCSLNTEVEYFPIEVSQATVVGYPLLALLSKSKTPPVLNEIFDRQSFLGKNSQTLLINIKIGIVGLGGGGSHIAQQLAHVGIGHFLIFDADHIEVTNHNRLIGGWFIDISAKLKKTIIAKRLIKKINPKTKVEIFSTRWQEYPEELKKCDIVLGCVDSYQEREQLESACRRVLIPFIDIGMDVHKINDLGNSISGQVILSMPGSPCMRCMQFITEEKLSEEAKRYGAAGGKPQVVWPNGVLASTAVGIAVDMITGWTNSKDKSVYLSYDGDRGHLAENPRIAFCPEECTHYKLENTGDVVFKKL